MKKKNAYCYLSQAKVGIKGIKIKQLNTQTITREVKRLYDKQQKWCKIWLVCV